MLTRMRNGASLQEPVEVSRQDASHAGTRAMLSIRGVSHSYGELQALEGLDAELAPGGVLGVVGASGCGKSTLLELIAGLREPRDGTIEVGGRPGPAERLELCAYMPQRDLLLPWLSALDNACLAPRLAGASRSAARAQSGPLFERFGLAGFERSRPAELSGGMRQRVAFLRTLMARRPLLLLDEPFAALDAISRGEMQSWLAGVLTDEAYTAVLVTHDIEEALYLCDRVVVLSPRPGRIAATLEPLEPRAPDRAAAVTSESFTELRQRALRVLAEGRP